MRVQFTISEAERIRLEVKAKKNGYPDISSYCKDISLGERTYGELWKNIKKKISTLKSGDEFSLRDLIDTPPANLGVKLYNNQEELEIEVLSTKDSLKSNRYRKK